MVSCRLLPPLVDVFLQNEDLRRGGHHDLKSVGEVGKAIVFKIFLCCRCLCSCPSWICVYYLGINIYIYIAIHDKYVYIYIYMYTVICIYKYINIQLSHRKMCETYYCNSKSNVHPRTMDFSPCLVRVTSQHPPSPCPSLSTRALDPLSGSVSMGFHLCLRAR